MKAHPAKKREEALTLRQAGHGYKTIGRLVGVSTTTVRRWTKPGFNERSKAIARKNKAKYRGVCVACGAATAWGSVNGKAATRCAPCRKTYEQSEAHRLTLQKWTRERIVLAIQEWAGLYGEPPAVPDWGPSLARTQLHDEARARRFEAADGKWPWFTIVVNRFGSWNAGIEAAGFSGRCASGAGGNIMRQRRMREREAA